MKKSTLLTDSNSSSSSTGTFSGYLLRSSSNCSGNLTESTQNESSMESSSQLYNETTGVSSHDSNLRASVSSAPSLIDQAAVAEPSSQDQCSAATGQLERKVSETDDEDSCPICLLEMIHPVRLPCSHIYCFLCLKGVTLTNDYTCPMCRGNIPRDYLTQPTLLTPPAPLKSGRQPRRAKSSTDEPPPEEQTKEYQWFYEGKNGWWRYDSRTNDEIEAAHVTDTPSLTLMLAGHNFTVDLVNMTQTRADGGGILRKIKRDSPKCQAKGTAGLHTSTLISAGTSRRKRKRKN